MLSFSQYLGSIPGPVSHGFSELAVDDVVSLGRAGLPPLKDPGLANRVFLMAITLLAFLVTGEILYRRLLKDRAGRHFHFLRIGTLLGQWTCTSIGMNVLNKTLISTLHAPCLITTVQISMVLLFISVILVVQKPQVKLKSVLSWMSVPFAFTCMLLSAFFALEQISLSLMMVVRNITPFIAFPVELIVQPKGKTPILNDWTILSGVFLAIGTLLYATSIPSISWAGLSFALINMFLAVFDRLLQGHLLATSCKDLPIEVCTWLNHLVGLLPALALVMNGQELSTLSDKLYDWHDPPTIGILLISGPFGLGMCYYGLALTKEISATSMLMAQTLSKVLTCTMGVMIFGDPIRSPWLVLGLAFSLCGSFIYGKAQVNEGDELKVDSKLPLLQEIKKKYVSV